jgi:hypothetical protein
MSVIYTKLVYKASFLLGFIDTNFIEYVFPEACARENREF